MKRARRFSFLALAFLVPGSIFAAEPKPVPDPKADVEAIAKSIIVASLKSPLSAVVTPVLTYEKDGTWRVRGTVDAQNSYGALVRSGYVCILNSASLDIYKYMMKAKLANDPKSCYMGEKEELDIFQEIQTKLKVATTASK